MDPPYQDESYSTGAKLELQEIELEIARIEAETERRSPFWQSFQLQMNEYTIALAVYELGEHGKPKRKAGDQWFLGTGVLVNYRDCHFIATCGHTFCEFYDRPICTLVICGGVTEGTIDKFLPSTQVFTTSLARKPLPGDWNRLDDLALIVLDPDDFAESGKTFYPLSSGPKSMGTGLTYFRGFPGVFVDDLPFSAIPPGQVKDIEHDEDTRWQKYRSVTLYGSLDPVPAGNASRDLFVTKVSPLSYETMQGDQRPSTFQGMSGCGTWCQYNERLALLGIAVAQEPAKVPDKIRSVHITRWMRLADSYLDSSPCRPELGPGYSETPNLNRPSAARIGPLKPGGPIVVFDEAIGVFARVELLEGGGWLLKQRQYWGLPWERSSVHPKRELAIDAALRYRDSFS